MTHSEVGLRPIDKQVYEEELLPWLPRHIIDFHVHVYLPEHMDPISAERKKERWPMEVAQHQSFEDMRNHFRMLFPKQQVSALVFGYVTRETHIQENNRYVLNGKSDPDNDVDALLVTRPEWDGSVIEKAMIEDGFVGIKPYPDLSGKGSLEVSIFDFLPRHHLAAVDKLAGIVVLHLPRKGRLGDENNIRELLEIADNYPSIKLVVAHVGRAYCMPTVMRGLPSLIGKKNVLFDITANVNPDVIEYTLQSVGDDRILYGSDLPIMLMRGMREYEGEEYINYTDGPYSWNTNRKSPEEEAKYTFFLYEELKALIEAVKRSGLGRETIEKILYTNSAKLLGRPIDSK